MNVPSCHKVVITGGPGGGKTTALDLFRRELGQQASIVPESASLLFSSGITRSDDHESIRSVQKAIFRLQHDLEDIIACQNPGKLLMCDRGTLDGLAYWPDRESNFFEMMNSSLEKELKRYQAVIFFETAAASGQDFNSNNPYRNESSQKALQLDKKLHRIWSQHPSFFFVPSNSSFVDKIIKGVQCIQTVIDQYT